MSKKNKVNPGQYTQAGRLSPDDAARELRKTQSAATSAPKERDQSDDSENDQPSAETDNQTRGARCG
jgi:hypothetical protein